jgi:hypothetical protein
VRQCRLMLALLQIRHLTWQAKTAVRHKTECRRDVTSHCWLARCTSAAGTEFGKE